MINFEEKIGQFNKLPLLKQSVITVALVGAIIGLINNYKGIKDTVGGLFVKYRENEQVGEFIKDVSKLFKPVTDKVESLLNKEEKGE